MVQPGSKEKGHTCTDTFMREEVVEVYKIHSPPFSPLCTSEGVSFVLIIQGGPTEKWGGSVCNA